MTYFIERLTLQPSLEPFKCFSAIRSRISEYCNVFMLKGFILRFSCTFLCSYYGFIKSFLLSILFVYGSNGHANLQKKVAATSPIQICIPFQ